MTEPGSLRLALGAALLLIGALVVETRVLLRWRSDRWFALAFPLGLRLVPIPTAPTGSGRTASVRWEVGRPGVVRFWADPDERVAPTGLRGVVYLARGRAGIELDVRWAPPLSPLVAAAWLAGLGVVRGEAAVTVPIAVMMVAGVGLLYWDRARRVAAELRWAFLRGEGI